MLHRGYAVTCSPIKLALEFSHTNAGNYAHEWKKHFSTEHFPIPWTWNGKRHGEFLSSLLCITCLFTMSWGYKVFFLNRKGWIYVREQGDVRNHLIREMHNFKKRNLKAPLLLLLVNDRNPSQQGKRCFLKCHFKIANAGESKTDHSSGSSMADSPYFWRKTSSNRILGVARSDSLQQVWKGH